MTYRQLMRYYKETRPTGIASHIGYTSQAVNGWKLKNRIPHCAQVAIENMAGGKLKASKRW